LALPGIALGFFVLAATASGGNLKEAQRQFIAGDYPGCIASTREAVREEPSNEEWPLLLGNALLAKGQYLEAAALLTNAVVRDRDSIRLRWLAREALESSGQTEAAADMVQQIIRKVSAHPGDYREAADLVVFGRAALTVNADPKRVLDTLFDPAKKADPKLRDVYLASGQLALDKHDFDLAAKRFEEGLKQLPDDPDLYYGLARAYAPSDPALMVSSIATALERNSNHVGCLLLLADHAIDAEDYSGAEQMLDQVDAVNPAHPDAWAYRAVLAHLRNQPQAEQKARAAGLKFWETNPRVDYLVGLKLSQNYRFTQGAAHQRQALQFDAAYLPAKAQLAEDLLRLGEETEGWKLAQEVQKQDGYHVEAFNLVALRDTMAKFTTLTNQNFLVRMGSHEAALYGNKVLELLGQARSNLCAKYGFEPSQRTTVEVFPEQKDFAVRTFGMPADPGYLGVCFGGVITANSPASHAAHPFNWEAVLWHEFCHVVTLQMTKNKMPRWLSEGISVFEERQANPAWGEQMTPRYREMVLGDDLKPISQLSAAFLSPPTPQHLQFAYYESSLVVEFIVGRFGLEHLKSILHDLGEGTEINKAIEQNTESMAQLEKDFAEFAQQRAESFGRGLDWSKPEWAEQGEGRGPFKNSSTRPSRTNAPNPGIDLTENVNERAWEEWAAQRPTNYWVMTRRAADLAERKQWPEAKVVLQKLVELCPESTGPEGPYELLAAAHRALGETNAERSVLAQFAAKDDTATEAYRRLMELGAAVRDWPAVLENARRYLAVAPMVALPYRFLAEASEQTRQFSSAISAYRALLELDPVDPSQIHYRLAKLLDQSGSPEALRQVLQALEEAPRYRDALQLLLEIENRRPTPDAT
jgi:tetratricopeptide (TPR) repeat protein